MFFGPTSLHRHICVFLLDLAFLPFYFDLTFPVFFLSFVLMHPEHYTDLDNLDTVENNLRHSAKGSNDAYDVTHSLTEPLVRPVDGRYVVPRIHDTPPPTVPASFRDLEAVKRHPRSVVSSVLDQSTPMVHGELRSELMMSEGGHQLLWT